MPASPAPSQPPSGRCPGRRSPSPRSAGYSHHPRLGAAAAGGVDEGDEAPWDGALQLAEAAGGEDVVCEGGGTDRQPW